jgi:hypothetical protein
MAVGLWNIMKTCVAFTFITGFFVIQAFGQGSAVIIKNRAKEVVNQNNVHQGVPPPSAAAPRPAPPAPTNPAAPIPTVSQAQSIAKLRTDLAGLKTGTVATPDQKQQLIKDLAVAARSTKPSLPTVTKFVNSLAAGVTEASLTGEQQARLAQNIEAVLNSKPLPATQFDAIIADVQAVLQVGSVKRASAVGIANDLKAVGAEVRR